MATQVEIAADIKTKFDQPLSDAFNRVAEKVKAASSVPTLNQTLATTQTAVATLKAALVFLDTN